MTLDTYIALFIAMLVVALIPGPAVLAITSSSAVGGFKRGALMTLGLVCADYIFIVLALSGLSFVAELMGDTFIIIKFVCAGYLIWMGFTLFFTKSAQHIAEYPTQRFHSSIIAGFLLTISNPKAITFYLALFPAFVDVQNATMGDTAGILLCATLAFGSVNFGYAYISAKAGKHVTTSKNSKWLRKGVGSVIVATGITVAIRD